MKFNAISAIALFFALSASAFAQNAVPPVPAAPAAPAVAVPAVPAAAVPAVPTDSSVAAGETAAPAEPADSVAVGETASPAETADSASVAAAPVAEPVPEPVVEPAVVAVAEVVAPVVIANAKPFIGLAPRISGGLSGLYGHGKVNGLKPNASFSFGGGVVAVVPLVEDFLYLDPAVQYALLRTHTEKSSKQSYFGGKEKFTATIVNHSVEIPVLFRFALPAGLFAEAGPQFSFILSSTTETEKPDGITGGKISEDTPDLNVFNFGGALGFGFSFTKEFSIDVRGQYGFLEYADNIYGKPWMVHLGVRYKVF